MERYKSLFKEYFVKEGSFIEDILGLNVFSDIIGENKLSNYEVEYDTNREWKQIERKFIKKIGNLDKIIQKNKKIKLNYDEVNIINNIWYDGSDAYDGIEFSIEYLPNIYNNQLNHVYDILSDKNLL